MTPVTVLKIGSLYHKYPRQTKEQPAYIEIDPKLRDVHATWNSEIGNAVPEDVWNGRLIRISVPSQIDSECLSEYLRDSEGQALLVRVCDGHEVVLSNGNRVGKLTEDAQDACYELERDIEDLPLDETCGEDEEE